MLIRQDQGLVWLDVEVPRVREALPVLEVGPGSATDLVFDAAGDLIASTQSQVSRYDVETGSIGVLAAYQAIWRHRVLPAPDGRLLTIAWIGDSSSSSPTVREIDTAGAVRVLGRRCAARFERPATTRGLFPHGTQSSSRIATLPGSTVPHWG